MTESKKVYKIIVIGEGGVGKTTIIHRAISNKFIDSMKITNYIDFKELKITNSFGITHTLQLCDFAGQPNYRFLQEENYKKADAAILVYDLTKISTINQIEKWVNNVRNYVPDIPILLVGTKKDILIDNVSEYSNLNNFICEKCNNNETLFLEKKENKNIPQVKCSKCKKIAVPTTYFAANSYKNKLNIFNHIITSSKTNENVSKVFLSIPEYFSDSLKIPM